MFLSPLQARPGPPQGCPHPSSARRVECAQCWLSPCLPELFPSTVGMEVSRCCVPGVASRCQGRSDPWPRRAQGVLQCQRDLRSMWLFYLLRSNLEPQDEIRNL